VQRKRLPLKVTKTGARHSHAIWFLVPVKLRNQYKTDEVDYYGVRAGLVEFKNTVLFVYKVERKVFGES
jgi:hypothetical protein